MAKTKKKTTRKRKSTELITDKTAIIIEGEYSNILARLHKKGIEPDLAIGLVFLRMGNSLIGRSKGHFNDLVKEIRKTIK